LNQPDQELSTQKIPRNIWAVSLTSFLMDISSEMVVNILPLFLSNVLGVKTATIGLIEGLAESTASILKLFSGWFSDKLGGRKWIAVAGYGLSAAMKPLFYFANTWSKVAGVRWADRVGKGIRTAPRDALVADSVSKQNRGLAFGLHRAADTGGAVIGLLVALLVVWRAQAGQVELGRSSFQSVVLISVIPAVLAVLSLAVLAKDVPLSNHKPLPRFAFRSLGKPFIGFILIVGLFELGNSSDAFLVLRAQEQGVSVIGVLGMLVIFNLVYALVSTPAGSLSDRIGRKRMVVLGWLLYAAVYLGFGLAGAARHIWILYGLYGLYYGLTYGTAKALVADLVPENLRGTAYGTYNAVLGVLDFPASIIAGLLWQGFGSWAGFGPQAPFLFSSGVVFLAAICLALWQPGKFSEESTY
jgi:MFS family permease